MAYQNKEKVFYTQSTSPNAPVARDLGFLLRENSDIIDAESVLEIYKTMRRKEILAKYTFPEHPSTDGYFHIAISDASLKGARKHIKAKTIEGLADKVYAWEVSGEKPEVPRSFKTIFSLVQKQKLVYAKDPERKVSIRNTIRRTKGEYRRFFEGTAFENTPVDLITKRDIEDIIFTNLKKYDLRKKGYQSLISIIKGVFDYAYNEYWINDNTYQRLDHKKFRNMILPDAPIDERVHKNEELIRMLQFCDERIARDPTYFPAHALKLQIMIAMRRGEVPPLTWADVREDHLYIHREQLTDKKDPNKPEVMIIVEHTKNDKVRRYPMTEELKAFLENLRAIHKEYGVKSQFLFPANTKLGCITNNTVYQYYRRMCNKLGIVISKERKKGTHSFRRNAVTKVANAAGGNLLLASQLYGNSPEVAKRHYYTGFDMEHALHVLANT